MARPARAEGARSEFLLLGTRPGAGELRTPAGEVSPRRAARDLVAVQRWHQGLRRWGLLRSFALPPDAASDVRACLIIVVSEDQAATRLAAAWGRLSGYRVKVLRLQPVPGVPAR